MAYTTVDRAGTYRSKPKTKSKEQQLVGGGDIGIGIEQYTKGVAARSSMAGVPYADISWQAV